MNDAIKLKTNESKQIFFLDFIKAISIVSAVSYHSVFVPASTYSDSFLILEILFAPLRFCVPMFLAINFLLSELSFDSKPNVETWNSLKKRLSRLTIPCITWFSIAIILKLLVGNPMSTLIYQILTGEIFTGGYYLLIVLQLTLLYFCFRGQFKKPIVLAILIAAQIVIFLGIKLALSSSCWMDIITLLKLLRRPLLFYWFAYIPLGIFCHKNLSWLVSQSRCLSWKVKAFMLGGLTILLVAEYTQLSILTNGSIPPLEYLMTSCLLSIPIFFLCFASVTYQQLGTNLGEITLLFSKYSLGIFCINGILSQVFLSLGSQWFYNAEFSFAEILIVKILGWIFLFFVSLKISILLEKIGLKMLVC
ncbi:acyltransferase family protein [Nodosilinea sp. E11]|uniref:acyltransferase family protein n=1 Tax=Nodosilinea sp. E11 TaxID=3037479 RepID=UPI002934268B|nr:acyltransferase family protein [Nodosilinea sp. E11]WOD37408.1 acyltransferase family protein [Nodosilinea sp. E11]